MGLFIKLEAGLADHLDEDTAPQTKWTRKDFPSNRKNDHIRG